MGMGNICRSYWETFPLFPGGKDKPSHWETFFLPLPTGKGFVLPLVNISHFYLKRVFHSHFETFTILDGKRLS